MALTRKFNDKLYTFYAAYTRKRTAADKAKQLRARGRLVRIHPSYNYDEGYRVWEIFTRG